MKKLFFSLIAVSTIVFTACNNSSTKTETEKHDMGTMSKDNMQEATAPVDKEVKTVAVTYTNVDVKIAASIKEIVDHYLHIKNALVNDNGSEAAGGAKAMEAVISKLDKSFFTADQKQVYDEMEADLKEHAEHIGKNGDKIKHQRSHFASLSEDVYELVKAFGGGRALYHDHCPMYNDNKGAMWISELKEVKNPYYGAEMLTCGTVEEAIQ
ncbi:MAG: DUF3347 domain-containing protein [Chitinophagaceae bacterium]|nr:DUF3347 domain-containing protein [Chitinophagaceae bacterium]